MGNFDFAKNVSYKNFRTKEIYENYIQALEHIEDAEKNIYLDFEKSGGEMRKCLECLVNCVINQEKKKKTVEDKVRREGRGNPVLKDFLDEVKYNNLLPDKKIFWETEKGKADGYSLDYLRQFGNAFHHSGDKDRNTIKKSFKNIRLALSIYHELFKYVCKKYCSIDYNEKFEPKKIPISNFITDEYKEPVDKLRSKCVAEIMAHTVDNKNEIDFYYILRIYNKENVDEKMLKRNAACFSKASKDETDGIVKGTVAIDEICSLENNRTDFYIISYKFNKKPYVLSDDILKEMSIDERIKFSYKIADCLFRLQYNIDDEDNNQAIVPTPVPENKKPSFSLLGLFKKNKNTEDKLTMPIAEKEYTKKEFPIYHRMLNYESVYVCKFGARYIPYLTKFDFAKIENITTTVNAYAFDAKEIIEDEKLSKYLPLEWLSIESFEEEEGIDWAKVDIFSLGVLISDILNGEIKTKRVNPDELSDEIPEKIKEILKKMCSEDPDKRPSIINVANTLKI